MQTRVDRHIFERTDFGSFGWLKEGPLTPAYDDSFFAAIESFSRQSVRTREREGLPSVRTDFGSFAWIYKVTETPAFDPVDFTASDYQLRSSFRTEDSKKLNVLLTDFGSYGWIYTGSLTPPYETEFFAGIHSFSQSFRSGENKKLNVLLTDFGSFGWIKTGSDTPYYDNTYFNAIDALTKSFRSKEGNKLNPYYDLNNSIFCAWFQGESGPAVVTPDYILAINPATGKLTRVVNNLGILKINKDDTDPTGGGGAASGRIALTDEDGNTIYLAYWR